MTTKRAKLKVLVVGIGGGGSRIAADIARHNRAWRSRMASPESQEIVFAIMDTNETSLQLLKQQDSSLNDLLLGAQSLQGKGSGDRRVARKAYDQSKKEILVLLNECDVVIPIATLGKATGTATIFPFCQHVVESGKIVVPVIIRPSLEYHEYDMAAKIHGDSVVKQLDEARIRFVEVLNDAAYQQRSRLRNAYESLNQPLAEGLTGLVSFLASPGDVDINDLVRHITGGRGRMRVAALTVDLKDDSQDNGLPSLVEKACENKFFQFDRKIGGALLITLGKGDNLQLSKIRGGLHNFLNKKDVRHSSESRILFQDSESDSPETTITILFSEYYDEVTDADINRVVWNYLPNLLQAGVPEDPTPVPIAVAESVPLITRGGNGTTPERMYLASDTAAHALHFRSLSALCQSIAKGNARALKIAEGGPNDLGEEDFVLTSDEVVGAKDFLKNEETFSKFSLEWKSRMLQALKSEARFHAYVVGEGSASVALAADTPIDVLEKYGTKARSEVSQQIGLMRLVIRLFGVEALREFEFAPVEEGAPGIVERAFRGLGKGGRRKQSDTPGVPLGQQ